jgi:hypothetical protein
MSDDATIKMTSAAGLGVVLLFVVSSLILPLTDAPGSDASAQAVARYLGDNRGELLAVLYLSGLSFGLFLVFAGGLRYLLRRAAGGDATPVPGIGFGGAIALVSILMAGFSLFVAAGYRVSETDPALVRALSDAAWATFALSGVPTAVCVGAFSWLILRDRYLPGAVAWLGFLVAALHLLAAAAYAGSSGGLSLQGDVAVYVPLGFYLWVLATSVALARRAG